MRTPRILLVDDDTVGLESLARGLSIISLQSEIITATEAKRAFALIEQHHPEVAIIDLSLNHTQGVEAGYTLLQQIVREDPACRVIVLTGHSGSDFGVRALALGAAHFISKPADLNHLAALIRDSIDQSLLRRTLARFQIEREQELSSGLIGRSAAAEQLRSEVAYASQSEQPVFIRGETGTGKGLCAYLIHQMSARRQHPFVRYQPLCGSTDLANSDLFGHRKGAFTGALDNRKGLLIHADHGTLFLDEIDELPRESQIALLGVLHDGSFRALGDNQTQRSNFRLLTASNAAIESKIERGLFRRDLFHRIAHCQIYIPPLRERRKDIELLVIHLIRKLKNRSSSTVEQIAPQALKRLESHDWPGNIRELEAATETALWRAHYRQSHTIEARDVLFTVSAPEYGAIKRSLPAQVKALEERVVRDALRSHSGSYSAAARALGIDRGTVKRIADRLSLRSGHPPSAHE